MLPFLAFDRRKMGVSWRANEGMHPEADIVVVGVFKQEKR